jgi:tRNA pseudouridine38-40 synthase
MPTYRLLIEYDGTRFAGWQVQASGRTVQGVLLEALRELTGDREVDLQGAGRTDAGVHALGQVASLRCRCLLDPARLWHDLERHLPADVAVLEVRAANRGFHARHDALARAYRYQVTCRRSAFGKRTTWWVEGTLDTGAMVRAAEAFVGRHDFRALAKRGGEGASTHVEVEACEIRAVGDLVLVRLVASHFLWNQVRCMVGALVTVGRHAATPDDVPLWLAGTAAPPLLAAPAAGLFLEAVRYRDEPWELPQLVPLGVPWLSGSAGKVLG